ncbi:serglycin domain-containing protein [Paramyrothecium foliicola]|nr:serglycin domain-containing protein [Paramyrothecium foliicola]
MLSLSHFITSLALAASVGAELVPFGMEYSQNGVARRDQQDDLRRMQMCASSVLSELVPAEPTNTAFREWATSARTPFACTITAPASLSSDYSSYADVVTEWLETVESDAAGKTDCGADYFTMTFSSAFCRSTRTVLFTDARNQTTTQTQEPFTVPTGTIHIGAAARPSAVLGSAMAAAVFLGAALAL